MRPCRLLLFLVPLSLALTACAPAIVSERCPPAESPYVAIGAMHKGDIVHTATGRSMTIDEALAWLAAHRVIYVGESHDSADDHDVQLRILRGLVARGDRPVAIGLEMVPRNHQGVLDAWLAGTIDDAAFEAVWRAGWGDTLRYYRPLLDLAKENGLRVLALNAERDLVKAVRAQPPEELAPEIASRVPELDLDDPWHRALIGAFFAGHAADAGVIEGFYRAQVLWDETMADTASRFLASPDGAEARLVIFAGGNHVRWGIGIPRRLFRRTPVSYAIVVPVTVEMPKEREAQLMDVDVPGMPMPIGDLLWGVGYGDVPKVALPAGHPR